MAWTDEKKAEVIAAYSEIMETQYKTDEERSKFTIEVVAQLAEQFGETVNGVRMILNKAGVYYKKAPGTPSASKASASSTEGGAKRVSKADALSELTSAISAIDPDLVDEEILSKLTGKAAAYFTTILLKVGN